MRKLAVIPSDPLEAYERKGTAGWLKDYYNPDGFFDQVYLLSPLETKTREAYGMKVVPTSPKEFKDRLTTLGINVVRAYGGYWACQLACENKVAGIPVIVSVHDTNPYLLFRAIALADVVFSVSQSVTELVSQRFKDTQRIWHLPNRVDTSKMKRKQSGTLFSDLDEKYPYPYKILHVGRKEKQKNLDTVIAALPALGPDYALVAIGLGMQDEYRGLAEKLDVSDRCFFVDAVPNEKLADYYNWADCMCTPSRWEGFGLVFIEALACGARVITSDIAPMNEYIRHLDNGYLVKDFENPEAIGDAIRKCCTDSDLSKQLSENGPLSIEKFSRQQVDSLEAGYYQKVLDMSGRAEFNTAWSIKARYGIYRNAKKGQSLLKRISQKFGPGEALN